MHVQVPDVGPQARGAAQVHPRQVVGLDGRAHAAASPGGRDDDVVAAGRGALREVEDVAQDAALLPGGVARTMRIWRTVRTGAGTRRQGGAAGAPRPRRRGAGSPGAISGAAGAATAAVAAWRRSARRRSGSASAGQRPSAGSASANGAGSWVAPGLSSTTSSPACSARLRCDRGRGAERHHRGDHRRRSAL